MDKLNKLRLLAGIPVKQGETQKKIVTEARAVPMRRAELAPKTIENLKARADHLDAAVRMVQSAIDHLDRVPATDFMGDIPAYISDLEEVLGGTDRGHGLANLAAVFKKELRSFKRNQGKLTENMDKLPEEPMDDLDAEFGPDRGEDLAADVPADVEAKAADEITGGEAPAPEFEKGDRVTCGEEEWTVVSEPENGMVALVPVGQEDNIDAIKLCDVADLEKVAGAAEQDDDNIVDPAPEGEMDAEVAADEIPQEEPAMDKPKLESINYYYDTFKDSHEEDEEKPVNVADGKANKNSVYREVKLKDDKNESPSQLNALGAPSNSDMETKVKVPSKIKTLLRDEMAHIEKEMENLSPNDKDNRWFYKNLHTAFGDLLKHLEAGTVHDIKKAQIFMTSLMGPMLHKIPAEVVNFVAKGGQNRSLKDYMKPVDAKYPVTGKPFENKG